MGRGSTTTTRALNALLFFFGFPCLDLQQSHHPSSGIGFHPPTQPASQRPRSPVTVLTSALLVATMERPGSMMRVRPDDLTMSRTVSIRSVGVGRMSPLCVWVMFVCVGV